MIIHDSQNPGNEQNMLQTLSDFVSSAETGSNVQSKRGIGRTNYTFVHLATKRGILFFQIYDSIFHIW